MRLSNDIEIIYSPSLEEHSPAFTSMSEASSSRDHRMSPVSAISNTSVFLPLMNQSAIESIRLPPHKSPKEISSQYFSSPMNLEVKEILEEFKSKDIFAKKDKRAKKDYSKALTDYGALKLEAKSKDINGEYIYGRLLLKEIEILKFETFFQIEQKYVDLMVAVEDYEDPYNTSKEKKSKEPRIEAELVELEELLRQLRFLDVERSKILQLQRPFQVGLLGKIRNFLGFKTTMKT